MSVLSTTNDTFTTKTFMKLICLLHRYDEQKLKSNSSDEIMGQNAKCPLHQVKTQYFDFVRAYRTEMRQI